MSLIELKNAVKEYTPGEITVRALDELSLGVQQGEIIVILGQSGSGKVRCSISCADWMS